MSKKKAKKELDKDALRRVKKMAETRMAKSTREPLANQNAGTNRTGKDWSALACLQARAGT